MKDDWFAFTWLVARRELMERARAKSFKVATVILLVAVAAGVAVPALISGQKPVVQVGLVGGSAGARAVALEAGKVTGTVVRARPEPSLAAAKEALRKGTLGLVVVAGKEVLLKQVTSSNGTSSLTALARAIAQLEGESELLASLPPAAAKAIERGAALPVRGLLPPPRSLTLKVTGFVAALVIYILLLTYGMRITVGTQEEKTSRVAEVLLSAIRPSQLLMGKVLGMGLLFLLQIVALLTTALVAAAASGSTLLRGSSPAVLGISAVWFLLGYAFYCTLFAAAGSMITRQADSYNATLPMQIPLILGYILADTLTFSSVSTFDKVLSFFPPTAPVIGPAIYAAGGVVLWQVALSCLLCVAGTVAVGRLASTIYARSLLRTGIRVKLRDALKNELAT